MMEWWLRRQYDARANKAGASDDFADYERWFGGPWTTEIARQMPFERLLAGPVDGAIDPQTRTVINLEIERRHRSWAPAISNIISSLALIVAIAALFANKCH